MSVTMQVNKHTDRLDFGHGCQVEGYLGQVGRSKVTRSKNILMATSMELLFEMEMPRKQLSDFRLFWNPTDYIRQ